MRGIFIALRELGLPLVIDLCRVSHHTVLRSSITIIILKCYWYSQQVICSCWFLKLTKKMQVIPKGYSFGRLIFHCLLRKKEKPLRVADIGQFCNSCRCSLQFVSWEFCSNSVHITAKRLLWKCYKNYSIFCSLLIFVAVMSHHRISVFSTLPVSQSHQNALKRNYASSIPFHEKF